MFRAPVPPHKARAPPTRTLTRRPANATEHGLRVSTQPQYKMPLPMIGATDEELFPALNLVFVGYACLIFLPRWRHTPALTLTVVTLYSAIYALLLVHRLALSPTPLPPISFDSLDHIAVLFADRAVRSSLGGITTLPSTSSSRATCCSTRRPAASRIWS